MTTLLVDGSSAMSSSMSNDGMEVDGVVEQPSTGDKAFSLDILQNELDAAKENVMDALDDNKQQYMKLLKAWFNQKISHDEFNEQARALLPDDLTSLHNDFIMLLIWRCQALTTQKVPKFALEKRASTAEGHKPPKRRVKVPRLNLDGREAATVGVDVPRLYTPCAVPRGPPLSSLPEAYWGGRQGALPPLHGIYAWLMMAAWENNIPRVAERSAHALLGGVRSFVRRLLVAMVKRRVGMRHQPLSTGAPPTVLRTGETAADSLVRGVGHGAERPNPELEADLSAGAAGSAGGGHMMQLTAWDMYHAIKEDPWLIPCHSVRTDLKEHLRAHLPCDTHETQAANSVLDQQLALDAYVAQQRKLAAAFS